MRYTTPLMFAIAATFGVLWAPSHLEVIAAQSESARDFAEPRVIEVTAKRYEFVPASIEVAQGEPVRIIVTSGDGFHGFGIKAFDVSKEIARGDTVTIDFTPDVVGTFPILCTEYCGEGHEDMKGVLVVLARETHEP
ncbi:MAG: cupredoxin domain-containing protein [Acidobacteria bacterium]|nr:cupredoxin domain-containing protein [Acidobacteriota bacterium]